MAIQEKKKNLSIEILKFISVFLILNGHMYNLYTRFDILATGGTIGNALFMFASGYTLLLGRFDRFDNWYKRRINRIYPSVIIWSIVYSCFYDGNVNILQTLLGGGRWFISCIMIYYILLYFIRYFLPKYKWHILIISCLLALFWYLFLEDNKDTFFMYRATYFKYVYWFPFMLLGSYIGAGFIPLKLNLKMDVILSIVCLVGHYAIMLICVGISDLCFLQPLSLIPLFGLTYYLFKIFDNNKVKDRIEKSSSRGFIIFVASLCLEIYIVQFKLFTTRFNELFPLNLLINVIYIIIVAYIIRCLSRFFLQLWREGPFDWKAIIK